MMSAVFWRSYWPFTFEMSKLISKASCNGNHKCLKKVFWRALELKDSSGARSP